MLQVVLGLDAKAIASAFLASPSAMRSAYEMAIGLERDPAVRRFLRQRQSALTT